MRVRLAHYLEELRSSYWFVPTLMTLGALILSFLTLAFDQEVRFEWARQLGFVWSGGAEGARALLSTVAGSMITVAGVAFSITIVALSLASSQFGPRVLRTFMRDTGNQVVLGAFIATFTYCLLILRTVRGPEEGNFVPYISVTFGVVLALGSLGVLIYFIHHVSLTIQAPNIVAGIAEDLFEAIRELFPAGMGLGPEQVQGRGLEDVPPNLQAGHLVLSADSGYLQALDGERLMELAIEHDLVLELIPRPGHFLVRGSGLVRAWPAQRWISAAARAHFDAQVRDLFILGRHRTPVQDEEFAFDQLAEVAVRSLSPSINDPFTAIACVDWLGAALARVAEREPVSPYRYDAKGRLRMVVDHPATFPALVETAFNQIREYARGSVAVRIRLLEAILTIAVQVRRREDAEALIRQANIIERGSEQEVSEREDRADITARYQRLMELLERP